MNTHYFRLLVILLVSYPVFLSAQSKLFTPEDASYNNPALYAKGLQNLQWIGETNEFTLIAKNCLVKGSATSPVRDTILKLTQLNDLLVQQGLKASKSFPSVKWIDATHFSVTRSNTIFVYDKADNKLEKVNSYPEDAENVDVDPKTFNVAFTRSNNLFISINNKEQAVSTESNKEILFGSERVHRNEFGITKGTFWSTNGKMLAFYRMDETMVTNYPLVDITTRIAEVKNSKYPMAGMTSHQVTVGVYNTESGEVIYLKTGEPAEQYLTNITWDPKAEHIYIAVLNRGQNHMKLNKYNVKTGELVKTLFEETSERYVEPENEPEFLPSDPARFVWLSERDGYKHMYLYDTAGTLLKQLTKGEWMVNQITGFSSKPDLIFFNATKDSPLQNNVYTVDIRKTVITRLTPEHGTHTGYPGCNGTYLIDSYSSTDIARRVLLYDNKGKMLQELLENKNPVAEYKMPVTSVFTIKNAEGTDLYCRLITPPEFDNKKKYPVIVYVYGGPHAQLINDSWLSGAGIYLNYLAQKGYVVFTLDNRGSANRGFEFESIIHRNCGKYEVEDQMAGVSYLKTLPYIDAERIGVDGWSYGGFMTINLLLENPGVFKAGCAGGPVCDWKYYEVMYGERYMDTPEENPDGFKNASLIEKAGKLKDKLMIIHCTTDPVVVWQNSLSFVQKCIENGQLIDYFVYPGHDHNVGGPDRAHLIRKIEEYFNHTL
jgi:dipeptidyl-peptidase-4